MRRVVVVLVIAACHSSSSAPPAPPPPASASAYEVPAPPPASLPKGIDPAVATEFAKLAGTDAAALRPLVGDGDTPTKLPGLVAEVPADRAEALARTERDHFAAQGYLIFRSRMHFGIQGQLDEIALIATRDQLDIVRAMGTNGANYGIETAEVIARLKEWDAKYGLVIFGAEGDYVYASWVRQPKDMKAFAAEVYKWCPDVVDQGTGTVAALAEEMKDENVLYLWWD